MPGPDPDGYSALDPDYNAVALAEIVPQVLRLVLFFRFFLFSYVLAARFRTGASGQEGLDLSGVVGWCV